MIEPIPERLERALRQTLAPGERVFVQLKGAFKEALVCTDFRVLILKGGWMTGQLLGTDTFQCPYPNIAGAEVRFHLFTGYFELSAGGMQNTPRSFWQTGKKPAAAHAPNCVSISGPETGKEVPAGMRCHTVAAGGRAADMRRGRHHRRAGAAGKIAGTRACCPKPSFAG